MKSTRTLVICIVAAAAVAAAGLGLLAFRMRQPAPVRLKASADRKTLDELALVLAEYNAQQKRYAAFLVDAGAVTDAKDRADLVLGPYTPGSVMWRSVGWRLWTRLETLAGIEGDLQRSIIRQLREGSVDGPAFEGLLAEAQGRGRAALVLPEAPASYARALETYLAKLGWDAKARIAEWTASGRLYRVATEREAFDVLRRGRAVFMVGSDEADRWLGRSADNHPEGFPLPGSKVPGVAWAIGRADAFSLPEGKKIGAGAADLLAYLTSKGVARRFAEKLPGAYYSWSEEPKKRELPVVDAPREFVQIE
jgi:hypothetical protein